MAVKKKTASKASPKETAPAVTSDERAKWAIHEKKVDKYTTIRRKVRVRETTCEVCGYDVITVNKDKFGVGEYDSLDPESKLLVRQILKKHESRHSPAEFTAARAKSRELESSKKE